MPATIHKLTLPVPMIERGFWLYVWRIKAPDGKLLLYVGRTGDSSSKNASAPFSRMGQHLSTNDKANAIRRHLAKRNICPEDCISIELVAYGPRFLEAENWDDHTKRRDKVAALEKALADGLSSGGYDVLNKVNSRKPLDANLWAEVKEAFSKDFPCLEGPRVQ